MNRINILLIVSIALLHTSCLDDEGNYDYTALNEVGIDGLESSYRFLLQEEVSLHPEVKTDIPQDRIEYCWRIGADTLARTCNLDYTFTRIPVSSNPLTFEARDRLTDVRYFKNMTVNVVSPFYSGWLILSDDNGKSVLDFQSYEAGNHYYADLYREVNGEPMSGTPLMVKQLNYQDGFTGAYADRVVVVNRDGKSVDLDGVSMLAYTPFEDSFKTDSRPSLTNVGAEWYNKNWSFVIPAVTDKGEVYGRTSGSMSTPEDGYFQYPYQGDELGYSLAPFIMMAGYNGYFFGFDEKNQRFVYFATSISSRVSPLAWNLTESLEGVNLDKIEGELIWMGTFLYNSNLYAVVKSGGDYTLYGMSINWDATATLTVCAKLPAGAVDDNSLFQLHPTSPYILMTKGNKLMALNLDNLGNVDDAVNDIATYEGDITALHYAFDNLKQVNELAVAIQTAAGQSSLLVIDPQLTSQGEVLERYDGIKGRVVSLCRKISVN